MNVNIKYGIILTLLFVMSCNSGDNVEYSYYPNGKVEYKRVYSDVDKQNYEEFKFLKNGELSYIWNVNQGKSNGKLFTYENNKLKMIKSFKNDTLHGLTKVFNLKYDLIKREFFFINGKMVLSKKFLTNKSIDWFMFDNYRISCSDSGLANGYLAWNNKEEVLSDQSHYYQVTATDTINKGESFNAIISFINQNVWHIRLELGEMDENLNYIEKPSVYEISNQLDVSIIPKNIGDNLLMGKLYAIRDTIVNGEIKEYEEEYIFYHEFYVREKKVNWWKFW